MAASVAMRPPNAPVVIATYGVPETRSKRARGEASRQRFLDAAAQIVGERGYEGTTTGSLGVLTGRSEFTKHPERMDRATAIFVDGLGAAAATSGVLSPSRAFAIPVCSAWVCFRRTDAGDWAAPSFAQFSPRPSCRASIESNSRSIPPTNLRLPSTSASGLYARASSDRPAS